MKRASYIQKTVIRFKRWTRKQYSIFRSLKREVSIGVLSKGIADASCEKVEMLKSAIKNNVLFDFYSEEKETEELCLEQLAMYTLPLASANDAAQQNNFYYRRILQLCRKQDFMPDFGFFYSTI